MGRVRIVTDSTADIPKQICEQLGIEVIPLKVHFGEETYVDGETIHAEQFYGKLARADNLPTTSQPSPADFMQIYRQLLTADPADEILSVHLSAALSGTYQSAVLAKSMLGEENRLHIVDSRSASYGIGNLVVAAAHAAAEGRSAEEILKLIEWGREHTGLFFIVDTLEYLQKGGRIGKASALIGSLLNIKPILSLDKEGVVISVDKIRGHKKAMTRAVEMLASYRAVGKFQLGVAHANSPQTADECLRLLREQFGVDDVLITSIGPVIGTHVGPGTVAVFLFPESV